MRPTQEQWLSVLDDLEAKHPQESWLPLLQVLIQKGGPVPDALGDRVRAMIQKSAHAQKTSTIEPMPTCPGPKMTATEVRLAQGAIEYYEDVAIEDGRKP